MKKLFLTVLVMVLACSLIACSAPVPPKAAEPEISESPLKSTAEETAPQETAAEITEDTVKAKEGSLTETHVSNYVGNIQRSLDQIGLKYEVGSKIGENQKADFEAGIYGFPFFQGDDFFFLATTNDNEIVDSVIVTLDEKTDFDDEDFAILTMNLQALDASVTLDGVKAALNGITKNGQGEIGFVQVSYEDGSFTMTQANTSND